MRIEQSAFIAVLLLLSNLSFLHVQGYDAREVPSPWVPSTIIVDPNGNGDYTDIQSAIDVAMSGDTIRVWNGTYTGSTSVHISVNLVGNGTSGTILDGQNNLDHQHLFNVITNGCNISGFQFKRSSPHHEFGGVGLYSNDNFISSNLFDDSNNGLYLANSNGNTIKNNTFTRNIRGIRAEMGSDNNDFIGNRFVVNLNYGFYYERSGGSRILNNTFNSNRQSVMLGYEVHNLTFDGNVFTNNLNRSALALTYCLDSSIHNNTFTGNREGVIIAMESHRNSVTWNNITENIEGVKIYKMYAHLGPCTQNVVNYNRIHNNSRFGLNASWTGGWITNAINNWWGSSTGPYHPTSNSPGTGDNVSDNVTFIPWLGGEPVNYPPIINDTGPMTAVEDREFFISFNATDPEGDDLSWEFGSDLPWLTWNPDNISVIGTPMNDDVGNGTITLKVSDPFDAFDEIMINLTVLNVAPEIMGFDKLYAFEDLYYEMDYTSSDDGQGNITWSLDTNSSWLEIDEIKGTLFGTPGNEEVGIYWVNVSVDDGNGGVGSRNITVTVRNTNDAPIPLKEKLSIQMLEDTIYSTNISYEFDDPDGDELEFSVFHQGKILVTIYANGTMELLPDPNWSGNENFTIYARDPYVEVSMEVNVTVIPVIDAPDDALIIAPSGPFYENTSYAFSGSASDPDIPYGDKLTYSWTLLPVGGARNGTTIELNLTAGNYTLLLNVSDLNGAYSTDMMDLEVLSIPYDNDTEPDNNDTEPDDDDEEPVPDDDEEPVDDDDDEPVDDDEDPKDDDSVSEVDDEPVDALLVIIVIAVLACIILIALLVLYLFVRKDPWEMEE